MFIEVNASYKFTNTRVMHQIPPVNHPSWKSLIKGDLTIEFKNYILQLRVTQVRKDVESGRISLEQAVVDIQALCDKYAIIVQEDIAAIFKLS